MRHLRPVDKQWLFTASTLGNTPSLDDGIPVETELKRRKTTIEYMRSLALRANAIANGDDAEATHLRGSLTVGSTLVHRFYMRRSLKDFNEKMIAPTILFLATKIEEEPLKLRHIVNACIGKFEPPGSKGWFPDLNAHEQPPREYRTWEKSILAIEEIVLEALCFDMAVDQPWVILRRAIRGLDEVIAKTSLDQNTISSSSSSSNSNSNSNTTSTMNGSIAKPVNGDVIGDNLEDGEIDASLNANVVPNGKGKEKLTENIVIELGWTMLSESTLSPLSILYPAQIISFISFIMVISLTDQIPLSEGLVAASELGDKFGLDISFSEDGDGVKGNDLDIVKHCLADFVRFMNEGLIDEGLSRYIVAEPEERKDRFRRRFTALLGDKDKVTKSETNGSVETELQSDQAQVKEEDLIKMGKRDVEMTESAPTPPS
ncbi:uncharacterized protein IL334_006289 [Kwoniella shivajii]|uniref:Cyclin N-terminal domain-containing protein n=1 Tax=Kwoniella shivajii TaxID=564305 RepID=A0ABZ1D7F1_9TREE|nr:hypothetical protein IL334_006289 [Kwoniella shivajii]